MREPLALVGPCHGASPPLLLEAATGLAKPALLAAHDLIGIPLVETQARFLKPPKKFGLKTMPAGSQ
jgi:hypothetical protein